MGDCAMQTHLKHLQRALRKQMPAPELVLWQKIRHQQLEVKFRRQYAIGRRILDFYAPSVRIGIEVDGETHFLNEVRRDKELESDSLLLQHYGIRILRILNTQVMRELPGVLEQIAAAIKGRRFPHLNPPPARQREEIVTAASTISSSLTRGRASE